METTKIGDVLLKLRTEAGESQEAVADAAGISRVAYTRYESNQREPKVSVAIALAKHFGVSAECLTDINADQSPTAMTTEEKSRAHALIDRMSDEQCQALISLLEKMTKK